MDSQRKQRLIKFGFLSLRAAAIYLIFALFSLAVFFSVRLFNYDNRGQYYYLSETAVCALGVFFPLLFYYSIIRASALHNGALCARFLELWDRDNPPGFLRRIRFTLSSPEFCADLTVHLLLLLIFPSAFGYRPLILLLGDYGNKGTLLAILVPAFLLLCVAARMTALSAWAVQWSRKAGAPAPEEPPRWKLPVTVLIIWICYLAASSVSPMVVRMIYSLFRILRLADPWILAAVLIGIVLLWYLIRGSVAVVKRRRLLQRLRTFCKENGYEMSGAQKWIRTLFFTDASANFTLQKGKTLYECRLISSLGRHSPLLFREEGTVTCTHVLRLFSLNLFHFDFTYDYRFEGTGTKLLILLPAPIEVFVSGYGVTQLAFPGSRISDYTIYGATDFLHALERNVIGR